VRSRAIITSLVALLSLSLLSSCGGARENTSNGTAVRDPLWATPLSRDGLSNLAAIEPDLYRGAQPLPEGFASLRAMGVRTIVNLRVAHSDLDEMREVGLAEGTFDYVEIPMIASRPDLEKARAFLAIARDAAKRPLFFHCKHGADRTGAMAAAYRVAVQGWAPEDAVAEMTDGGFGYHAVFYEIPRFVMGSGALRAAQW